eukprot:gnl/MRDRNA2_/MRDRNA2_20684_c0_seq1.p1 gnl/MRDRNA2_/MRDRNA2_20684_c0~~gnl/MRDRNA2_/MRDRNA2_20684_c0_seq1.p1  ORF type:complete len:161 (-),score=44.97 gnl/MRDRNA2_/MRDRNA2_20684_c0_seq1:341-823(-)
MLLFVVLNVIAVTNATKAPSANKDSNDISLKELIEELGSDREAVLGALKKWGGDALRYASKDMQADKKVVMEAVKTWGRALKYAAKELRADKEVVMEAVKHPDGLALRYAAKELRADREVVMQAVRHSLKGDALQYAAAELQVDREVIMERTSTGGGLEL